MATAAISKTRSGRGASRLRPAAITRWARPWRYAIDTNISCPFIVVCGLLACISALRKSTTFTCFIFLPCSRTCKFPPSSFAWNIRHYHCDELPRPTSCRLTGRRAKRNNTTAPEGLKSIYLDLPFLRLLSSTDCSAAFCRGLTSTESLTAIRHERARLWFHPHHKRSRSIQPECSHFRTDSGK